MEKNFMPKVYDIIPPKKTMRRRRKKIEKKSPDFGLLMKRLIIKTTCVLVIISLNWAGLSAVIETFAYQNDTETSSENSFTAGILDFELQSTSDFPSVCSDKPTSRTISIVNYANPFKYVSSSAEFSGDVCDYVNLEANIDGGDPEYTGPLKEFNFGPLDFSDPDDWVFTATFNPDLPAGLLGQTCTFKFVFDGSQTKNDLPFGQGFTDTEEITNNIRVDVCCTTEIRSCGYWKNHSNVYKDHLPQTLGGYPTDEIINTVTKANNILTAACGTCGCGCDKTMRAKLKGQLLAMKFNIAHFGIGEYLVESEGTLNEIVAEADNLLRQNPPPPDSVLEEMKDLLDTLNNLGQIPFCSETPPDECQLQITKTASADEIGRGDTITYHLTLDNIGGKVCTGSGVLLKDTFENTLQYINYTSTRKPDSFNKSSNYIQWNFGNINPNDPLIEIDLKMKVSGCAKCDSVITNSVKYWSTETDWGEPVTVDTQVVCEPVPDTGIVLNEFLPNPAGKDNAPKPNGEWVELYNKGSADVDVAGWVLYDENDTNELYINSGKTNTGSTVIAAGGFLVVYRNGDSDFALDNRGGDTVRLYDGKISDGANLIDSHTYTINASEGKSFARIPDGSDNWVDPLPTPGEPNVMDEGVEIDFGPALLEEGEEGYEEIYSETTGGAGASTEQSTPDEESVIEEPVDEQPIEEQAPPEENTNKPTEEPVVEETPVSTEEMPVVEESINEEPTSSPATLPEEDILNGLSNDESSENSPESSPETPTEETATETPVESPVETPAEVSEPASEI